MSQLKDDFDSIELPDDRYLKVLVDVHAFRDFKKRELGSIRAKLKSWVLANRGLQPENSRKAVSKRAGPPELPVRVLLQCFQARGQMRGKVQVARIAPENLEELRRERIRDAISAKGPKLEAEHRLGSVSVLVLEDSDIAISNHIVIADCVHSEVQSREYWIDEIYLVETFWPDEWLVHTLKKGSSIWPTECDNPPRAVFLPDELTDLLEA
jgi:hypothetical protein